MDTLTKSGAAASNSHENRAQGFPDLPNNQIQAAPLRNSTHPPSHSNYARNQNPFPRHRKYSSRNKSNSQSENPGYNNASPQGNGSHKPGSGYDNDAPQIQAPKSPKGQTTNEQEYTGCKVQVSGYPRYTQPQDLNQTFAKFGQVKDVCMYNKHASKQAVVSFGTAAEARAAILASTKVNVYGHFLAVVPHKPGKRNKLQRNKREFPRSKEKGTVLDPKQIDLSGNFHEQLDKILDTIRLTQEEVELIGTLYDDLQEALQDTFPGCVAMPFGSIVFGLGIKSSDADCFVDIPPAYRQYQAKIVNMAKRDLSRYPHVFSEILCIPRANTPIVKFFHIPTETNCDVSFKTLLGVRNSKLISFLLRADPRIIPLCVVVKYWAKVHGLSGSGKLTNYALTLLVIFYLQQSLLKILPTIHWLQRDPENDFIVDFWNTGFTTKLDAISCETSIPELLGGFFEFYSTFNFDELMVCPYLGYPLKKEIFKDINQLPNEFELYKDNIINGNSFPIRFTTSICIQDPIEQGHNVSCSISSRLAMEIKEYFKFAATAYEKDKDNNLQEFLKIILLQKPKISHEKSNPEYRVLFPKMIANIISPDWKSVVREVVFTVFDKMLKLKLEKIEEKVTPNARKEKEKYTGTITKHLWKRKQFYREYNNMDLEEKESKITEQILKTDKSELKLEFQLTITFDNDSKSGLLGVRLVNGNVAVFREFGRFFKAVIQHWFIYLLRPHCKNDKNEATNIAKALEVRKKKIDKSLNEADYDQSIPRNVNGENIDDDVTNDDIDNDDNNNSDNDDNNDSDNSSNELVNDDITNDDLEIEDRTQSDNENMGNNDAKHCKTTKDERDVKN